MVAQHFKCSNIYQTAYMIPRQGVTLMFLSQYVDVMFLVEKYIVVRYFVCGVYDKIILGTGKVF